MGVSKNKTYFIQVERYEFNVLALNLMQRLYIPTALLHLALYRNMHTLLKKTYYIFHYFAKFFRFLKKK